MGRFFIETNTGHVATHRQLLKAGLINEGDDAPQRPWHPVQGPPDASTMWFAVLRKKTRGIFIGTLVLRHGGHHAFLLSDGWESVEIPDIGVPEADQPI
jgi:hypothetical protein